MIRFGGWLVGFCGWGVGNAKVITKHAGLNVLV